MKFDQGLLGGVVVIEGSAKVANPAAWDGKLYRALGDCSEAGVALKAVP